MGKLSWAFSILLLVTVSCLRQEQSGRETIDIVKEIAADSSLPESKLLSGFTRLPSGGDIAIIGSSVSCVQLGQSFLSCDEYENVRGMKRSDDLMDFAGETFSLMCDTACTPYDEFLQEKGEKALRESAVRKVLAALSQKCSVSIYDLEGNQEKNPAKMIILADPWLLQYGKFDIDTLFTLTSCKVPVFSPQGLMMDAAFAGERKYFNIGIIGAPSCVGKGIYRSIFDAKAKEHGIVGARFFEASADKASANIIGSFLDSYIQSGRTEPLDAILVDDWDLDMERLEQDLQAVRDFSREESMLYGKLVSPVFLLAGSSSLTMSACYEKLRELSLFTHRIALPELKSYTFSATPAGSETPFLLIPSDNV
ncbi:MAG: hypothetical protein J5640_08645 [Bacteroidales bacterium]|nr:hypothetical protein [Bacteroidales bacterium]